MKHFQEWWTMRIRKDGKGKDIFNSVGSKKCETIKGITIEEKKVIPINKMGNILDTIK